MTETFYSEQRTIRLSHQVKSISPKQKKYHSDTTNLPLTQKQKDSIEGNIRITLPIKVKAKHPHCFQTDDGHPGFLSNV